MRVILDTNVFVSGVFFSGPPHRILTAWRDGKRHLAVSPDIMVEYERIGQRLAERFPSVSLEPFLDLVAQYAQIVWAPQLPQPVCVDPDDDKFLACALAASCKLIISGDKHLLHVKGYADVTIMRPREFTEMHLERQP